MKWSYFPDSIQLLGRYDFRIDIQDVNRWVFFYRWIFIAALIQRIRATTNNNNNNALRTLENNHKNTNQNGHLRRFFFIDIPIESIL